MSHLDPLISVSLERQAEKVRQVQAVGLDPRAPTEARPASADDGAASRRLGRRLVAAGVAGAALFALAMGLFERF